MGGARRGDVSAVWRGDVSAAWRGDVSAAWRGVDQPVRSYLHGRGVVH